MQKKASFRRAFKKYYSGYLYIMPVLVGIAVFTIGPMVSSLYYSMFKSYKLITPPKDFAPFFNLTKMVMQDEYVWVALRNTIVYSVVSIPFGMALSFVLALFLNTKLRGIRVFRVVYYLPCIIPVAVSGLIWRNFINVEDGVFNGFLKSLNMKPLPWLQSEAMAFPTLLFMSLWGLGGGMILWLAALKNVPATLTESAKIDGAGRLTRLFKITVPMCTPTILYNFIMGIIGSLQMFGGILALTGGGDGRNHSLLFYVMKIYNDAFAGGIGNFAYAAAESWILFMIIAILTFVVFKTSKWVFYGE